MLLILQPSDSLDHRNRWMTAHMNRIEVTLESIFDSVDLAEDIALRVAEAAGFEEDDRHKLGMAVREGIINALQYGNRMSPEKHVFLTLVLDPEKLLVRVLDQGEGFDLADVPDPLAEENLLRASGRGILLMRSFMEDFSVVRGPHGGAELTMVMRFPKSRGAGPAHHGGHGRQKEGLST